jgi:uncharacterized membrane protein HdeD (DUF308 family)
VCRRAKPAAVAANAVASSAPATPRRRNFLVRAVLVVLSGVWVIAEVFMALIVHPARGSH